MKKNIFLCAATLAMLSFSSCSDDINYNTDGEGRLMLKAVLNTDVQTRESRAGVTDDELAASTLIWISNSKGVVRKYNGMAEVPAAGVNLVADNYIAEAWAGDSVSASFDHRYYKGAERFTISAGSTVQVQIECKIANVVTVARFDDVLDELLSEYTLTVGHKRGEITYNGREDEDRNAYFMMPSSDPNLTYTFSGTTNQGAKVSVTGVIENAKAATRYVLNVKHTQTDPGEFGGAIFDIEVDESEVEVVDRVEIVAAPVISGLNFDIDAENVAEEGQQETKKVWIQSAAPLAEVVIASPDFVEQLGISGNEFEIFGTQADILSGIAAKGIVYQLFTHDDSDFQEMKITIEDTYLNNLGNGEHPITITAIDTNNRTATKVLKLVVSDAKVKTPATLAEAAWSREVTLYGQVMADDAAGLGFEYRQLGTQQWTFVAADEEAQAVRASRAAKGSTYKATVTGLTPGATYEYRAVSDGFAASVATFTTQEEPQIPNGGFEDWDTSSKTYLLYAPGGQMYWDSGNHGATTMPNSNSITTPSTDYVHSGNYSIRMESKFIGIGFVGKFAAGNAFVGKYLATDGTDGVLGWGRTFNGRPKALKGYVKYTPGTVSYTASGAPDIVKGELDKGRIFVAILDSSKNFSYDGEAWPFVVKTKSSDRQIFNPDTEANILGYGEMTWSEATPGDGMVEFNIPIDYRRLDAPGANLILVLTASKGGDYFAGGPSVMYVDDLEMVY